jgi:predicted aspartyl protease
VIRKKSSGNEKAVFNIKEMRIGNQTVRDIKAIVNSKIKTTILFGENTLTRFGNFTIDEKESLLIFQD